MSKNNGGPAFPTRLANHGFETIEGYEGEEIASGMCSIYPGMTLRDYFAAQALQAIIAKAPFGDSLHGSAEQVRAAHVRLMQSRAALAYDYADAMLKSRGE